MNTACRKGTRITDAAQEFLAQQHIAITGVSRTPGSHGANVVYRRLRDRGYVVFAVNPHAQSVEGDRCWPDLTSIPEQVDAVVVATSPEHAEATVRECIQRGIRHVWMHRSIDGGSVSAAAVELGRANGVQVIDGGCPCMFPPASDPAHRVMRGLLTLTGAFPGACSQLGTLASFRGSRRRRCWEASSRSSQGGEMALGKERASLHRRPLIDRPAVLTSGLAPYRLSLLLAAVAVLAALPTLLVPSLLTGPAVMIGSARGTALVLLVLTVPMLLLSARATSRGSVRGIVVWAGAVAHLTYQSVMFCFATPLNPLFLLYVAMLGLSVWTGAVLLARTDVAAVASRFSGPVPTRLIAGVLGVVATLNALLWLARIVPTISADEPTSILDGSGLTTNPVFVQDLALWLPLAFVAAVALWQQRPAGHFAASAVLTLWTLEGATVATDQWFGHRADPTTEWATTEAAWIFVVLTVVTLIPLLLHLKCVDRD